MIKKTHARKLIISYFLKNFIHLIGMSILPLLLLYFAFSIILIPSEKKNMEKSTAATLSLVRENISLLLNDTSKIMDTIDTSISSYALTQVFESEIEGYIGSYVEFLTCKQIALYMNSIVNTRDYIDSIYVYLPNSNNAYITNQMNIFHLESSTDSLWLSECFSANTHDLFRRTIQGNRHDTITITERNQKGYIVAININASYFERLFKEMATIDKQKIILTKKDGAAIASNTSQNELSKIMKRYLESNGSSSFIYEDHTIFTIPIENYNAYCISVIPNNVLFSYEINLLKITIAISFVCIIISLIISILYSYQMTKRINSIIELLQNSLEPQKLENIKPMKNDVYGYITNHLIRTFLQNDYMKIALNEKKMELKVQELSALQYQINPHFLSNTLQMIDFEILRLTKKPTKANCMIECLSRFLHYSLRAPEQRVFLWQEVKATKDYTEIMNERFQDQISFIWNISEECMNFELPKLILQPLLENSIQHNAQIEKKLIVVVSARIEDNKTILEISDNGKGASEEQIESIMKTILDHEIKENHIGLSNIIRKMQLEFGEAFSYKISSTKDSGFSVCLIIN